MTSNEAPTTPFITNAPDRTAHTFGALYSTGLLWYINRALFYPLGYALAIEGPEDNPLGWTLHHAGKPVSFEAPLADAEADRLRWLEALLADARRHGVSPEGGAPFFRQPEGVT